MTLTDDQQTAYEAFATFLLDPQEAVFVLSGYSGTGKTTLVKTLLERLPNLLKATKLVDPHHPILRLETQLTATTNKAAEAFTRATGNSVRTIHSFLGLRVITNYRTNTSQLISSRPQDVIEDTLLFIDEASYVDSALLALIFAKTTNCKIVFMGDPAQLLQVKCQTPPVFTAGFKGAQLTQVVRQAEGNPIIALSTKFRHTVNSGEFFSFVPDGVAVQYLDRPGFDALIEDEFTDPTWTYNRSKVLAWTNKTVIAYNRAIRDCVSGDPQLNVDDYALCNKHVRVGKESIKTDQLVHITNITSSVSCGVTGHDFLLDARYTCFMPDSLLAKTDRLKRAKAEEDYATVQHIQDQWIDLRAAYACTINKSQGSTYDKVFIDLDDIKRCNSGNQIARMLYVAVSRARNRVYLCGDLI